MWLVGMVFLACQPKDAEGLDSADSVVDDSPPGDSEIGDSEVDTGVTALTLSFLDSRRVDPAAIWSGLSYDGETVRFTTMNATQLQLHRWDAALEPVGEVVQLTTSEDTPEGQGIADHAHLWIDDHLYVAYCTGDARNLYLLKVDAEGERVGSIAAVAENATGLTNDMHLASDGESITVWWGDSGFEHWVRRYDFDLNPLEEAFAVHPLEPIPQLGSTVWHDGQFLKFTGDGPQRNLIVSRWDADHAPEEEFAQVVVPSENNEWNWFSSGSAFDVERGVWFLAFNHMEDGQAADTDATIRLAAFTEDFELLWADEVTGPGMTRPHLAVVEDTLLLSYDGGVVFLDRFAIE